MAKKIKITESQLKMILKNKALTEAALGEDPHVKSNDLSGFDVRDGKFVDEPEHGPSFDDNHEKPEDGPSFDDAYKSPEEEGDGEMPFDFSLNEGQLKLKREFEKLTRKPNDKGLSGEIKNKSKK